ncbi:MAG: SDR family NAD(P)-dependent oxidoreductase [Leptospiraceae bacterium]|nr:SDR family NAD(P)-dependent oxidoreductase [Leptospiraceae bacterium]
MSTQTPAVLITGGAVRLGRQLALHMARSGYHVALHFNRSSAAAEATAADIRNMGAQCALFGLDFQDSSTDYEAYIQLVRRHFPGLRILINSASVYDPAPIAQSDMHLVQKQFLVNFMAPFQLTRWFAHTASGSDSSVINILDNKIAYHQFPYAAYALSKSTLAEFTRMAALEFAPYIRVNGIAPGVILPAEERTTDYLEWRSAGIPLRRMGSPDHITRALDYILNNDFLTGQILFVDGGESENFIGRNATDYKPEHPTPLESPPEHREQGP